MYSNVYKYPEGQRQTLLDLPVDSFVSRVADCAAANPYECKLGWADVQAFCGAWLESDRLAQKACDYLAPRKGNPQFLQRILESPLMLGAFCYRLERWGVPKYGTRPTILLQEAVMAWLLYPIVTDYTDGIYADAAKLAFYKALADTDYYYFNQEYIRVLWGRTQLADAPPGLMYELVSHGLLRYEDQVNEPDGKPGYALYLSVTCLYEVLPLLNDLPELLARKGAVSH